jgi:transposase
MSKITIIGVDLAKHVFQIHAVDAMGCCVLRRQLKRSQVLDFFARLEPCVVAMEACGTAQHWAREIAKLGHEARLLPPSYVKAYVKRGKNDAVDAEAITEAAGRPSMRFVPVKTIDQQALALQHRTRDLLVKTRTMHVNALRSHLAEFGFVAGKGIGKYPDLVKIVAEAPAERLPDMARRTLTGVIGMIVHLNEQIGAIEKELRSWHRSNTQSQRLETAPGIGLITATALAALTPGPKLFENGRHFAAWIGITPREDSTGGKTRLKGISKAGDGYLRRLLVLGATSLLRSLEGKTTRLALWVQGLLARRPRKVVIIALANKLARIAWAIMAKGEKYRAEIIQTEARAVT